MNFRVHVLSLFAILFSASLVFANPSQINDSSGITFQQRVLDFSAVYGAQWTVYLITQKDTITDHGSWDNFFSYPLHPEFDKDSFDFNIFKHALSGNYYYLYYRYRGYEQTDAFLWTFLSSLAFEFAVETYTEKPSIQDIYQTPIYGTLVGMGFERLSTYFRAKDSVALRSLGYILNPFTLLPNHPENVAALPQVSDQSVGLQVVVGF
ncbi:DUF3943 domain-containing protein [Bdellovibrio bacteriovorus]|uniref:DUF3943 domain-containing protein n=1 Tax=Bdellovibrio bacteriovorus TaxID=959 RepID=UPI0035A5732B